ncbi:MAG: ankyrin repeat domain-containing protein [Thermoguttaceae bacterium]
MNRNFLTLIIIFVAFWRVHFSVCPFADTVVINAAEKTNRIDEEEDKFDKFVSRLSSIDDFSWESKKVEIEQLLKEYPHFAAKNNKDQSLLFTFFEKQTDYYWDAGAMDFLIAEGVNVNDRDKDGRTAIFYAAAQSDRKPIIYWYLVEHDAELDIVDSIGWTPLFALCANRTWIQEARVAANLVEKGKLSVNDCDKDGMTPLMYAVIAADPNEEYTRRNTSRGTADYVEYELIKYLLSQGADVNVKDNNNESALDKAIKLKNERVVELLSASM